jgi:putative hydroxymethylpyrimidine transport system substrate-binding protein
MLTRSLRGHAALFASGLICLLACAGCGEVATRTTLGPLRGVVVATDGSPSGLYAPIYEGIANGDFARGALSVSVNVSASAPAALSALSAGSASLAVTSEPALLAARASGAKLVAIGALVQGPLESIISLGSHPVSAPAQLVGKTVATNGTALATAELASFLAQAAIPPGRVHTIDAGGDVDAPLLTRKAVASIGGLWDYDAVALALAHHKPSVIRMPAIGVPSFSELVIVARIGEAHYDGPLLRAFLQSLTIAQRAVRTNPGAVASLLARANPHLSARLELAVILATEPASAPPAGDPFGYQNPTAWEAFGNWMSSHGLLTAPTDGGYAITDEFLPGQGE